MSRSFARALPAHDASIAALLCAIDPAGLGGVVLRGMPGPARDRWLRHLQQLLPDATPWLRVPVNVSDDRLLGGLDFAATVSSRAPVFATGLLESADGGFMVLSMAERLREPAAAMIAAAVDQGEVSIERDGVARKSASRISVIAFDEGMEPEERISDALADRLAFHIRLADLATIDIDPDGWTASDVLQARRRLTSVRAGDGVVQRLCQSAAAFGIPSPRADLLAVRAACALAAALGADEVGDAEASVAARLVFPQRARQLPQSDAEAEADREVDQKLAADDEQTAPPSPDSGIPDDVIVDAVRSAIPAGLLDLLLRQMPQQRRQSAGGRSGPDASSRRRGRPVGIQPFKASAGSRINVLATLKAAAPWQTLRQQSSGQDGRTLKLRGTDLRVTRYKDRVETTTVFVVDASGSQAAQRLAEVKGAIELLLNDCYVRRDQVALIAFRGTRAEVLLSPTRALARAKRSLAALPGGGGTPLATGIETARELAESVARSGRIPSIVLLTDGRANVARDSRQGAERAEKDALEAGRQLQLAGLRAMLVDTSRRPRPRARALAEAMGAPYIPLPRADAESISTTVQRVVAP